MIEFIIAVVAVALLVLYVVAVAQMVLKPTTAPSDAVQIVLTTVGPLVSSLVVAVLAVTAKSGATNPATPLAESFMGTGAKPPDTLTILVGAYIAVWIGTGLWTVIVWMLTPSPSVTLKSAARTWLGVAVGVVMAYFGLKS